MHKNNYDNNYLKKEILSSNKLRFLEAEERNLLENIRQLKEKASNIENFSSKNISGRTSSHSDYFMSFIGDLEKLEELLLVNLHKTIKERIKLERFIASISDEEIRLILRLRLIDGFSWEKIGLTVCMDGSAVRRKVNKALDKNN